jgi:hypothetical protein
MSPTLTIPNADALPIVAPIEHDLTDTIAIHVAASPPTVARFVRPAFVCEQATRLVDALGAVERLAAGPTLLAPSGPSAWRFGLVWRVEAPAPEELLAPGGCRAESPGHVAVTWTLRLSPTGSGSTLATVAVGFAASDDTTRERLLAVAGPVTSVARALATRMLAGIRESAQEGEDGEAWWD